MWATESRQCLNTTENWRNLVLFLFASMIWPLMHYVSRKLSWHYLFRKKVVRSNFSWSTAMFFTWSKFLEISSVDQNSSFSGDQNLSFSVDQNSSFSVDQKFIRLTWSKLFANLFRRSKLVFFKRSKLVFFKRSKLFATLVSWSNVLFFSISEVQKTLD